MSNSISADQVAAQQLGKDTRFSSIQLDTADGSGSGHGPGLSLAWDQRGKPVAGFSDPVQLFHKLFSADDLPLDERQAAIAKNRSVLDAVFTEAKRVQRGLTKTDTDKIDEYFQGIRDIETRLNKDEDWLNVPKAESPMDEPKQGLKGRDEIKVMYDLIVAAYVLINGLLATTTALTASPVTNFTRSLYRPIRPAEDCWAWSLSTPWAAMASTVVRSNVAPGVLRHLLTIRHHLHHRTCRRFPD